MVSEYDRWMTRFDKLGPADFRAMRAHLAEERLPAPVVIARFDRESEVHVRSTIEALRAQLLEDWRAHLYFDRGCSAQSVMLAQTAAAGDARITVRRMSRDTERATGHNDLTGAVLLQGGVVFRQHAIYMFVLAAKRHEFAIVYSDEDHLTDGGEREAPIFKPVFSPELFVNRNYLGNCVFARAPSDVLENAIDGFISGNRDISSVVDELVRSANPRNILHVPHILFHDALRRPSRGAIKEWEPLGSPLPLVSIIVPTRDRVDLLRPCLESIQRETEYPSDRFEIIVVDNGSREEETARFLATSAMDGKVRVMRDSGSFNFSRINNRAVTHSRSEVLVFLNNDTTIIDPLWLYRLVAFAMRGDVAAVGGKLLYPDGTVQHGGVVVGIHCAATHSHVGIAQDDPGFQGLANLTREVAAVTAACMAIRRGLFEELGGFDEALAVSFNDTDLCLRALERGYRNIYLSDALAVHYESKTRGLDDTPNKIAMARQEAEMTRMKHVRSFKCDPYYNPNLSVDRLYELAFPPRRTKPWRDHARRGGRLRILFLSSVHRANDRISRIIDMHARDLVAAGHEVFVGGPKSDAEPAYPDCRRVELALPQDAASFAVENDIDCVVAHEWPFFSVARWTGESPKVICCDHGQLPREIFEDERERIETEKRLSFSVADSVIPAFATDGRRLTSTQMLKCVGQAIETLCLRSTARVPVNFPRQDSPPGAQNGYIAGVSGASSACVVRASNLKGTDRREFYARLRGLSGSEFVDRAYLAILGRHADQSGRRYYIDQFSKGVARDRIVWEIATSDEAKARGVCASDVMAAAGLAYIADETTPGKRSALSALLTKLWPGALRATLTRIRKAHRTE